MDSPYGKGQDSYPGPMRRAQVRGEPRWKITFDTISEEAARKRLPQLKRLSYRATSLRPYDVRTACSTEQAASDAVDLPASAHPTFGSVVCPTALSRSRRTPSSQLPQFPSDQTVPC